MKHRERKKQNGFPEKNKQFGGDMFKKLFFKDIKPLSMPNSLRKPSYT